MFFYKPTVWDLFKMMWWGLTNPAPKPIPAAAHDAGSCPLCRRRY